MIVNISHPAPDFEAIVPVYRQACFVLGTYYLILLILDT